MADALCGPSNALQNFQKHSTVDRTLQQDRLATRHSPSQGFRSSPGPNAGLLDPEFEAFQAGQIPLPLPEAPQFHPSGFPGSYAPQQLNQPSSSAWATDFQQLSIASPSPQYQQRNYAQQSQPQQLGNGWQDEFAKQQSQSTGPTTSSYAGYNSIPFQRLSTIAPMAPLQTPNYAVTASQGQLDQPQTQNAEAFNEEAFARAFDLAAQSELAMEQAAQQQNLVVDQDVLVNESAERLMGSDQVPETQRLGADLIHDPRQGEKEEQQQNDPDALARTAGQLLDSVKDNQSDKFQRSQFLELMRQLRDREVTVEGDKIVGVQSEGSESSKGKDALEKSLLSIARQLSLLDFARVEPLLDLAPVHSSSFRPVPDQLILGAFIRTLMQVSAALKILMRQHPNLMKRAKPFGMSIGVEVFALAQNPLIEAYPALKALVLSFKSQFLELGIDPRMVRRATDLLSAHGSVNGEEEVAASETGEAQLRAWLGRWLASINARRSAGAEWLFSERQVRELLGEDIYPYAGAGAGAGAVESGSGEEKDLEKEMAAAAPTQRHLDRIRDILGQHILSAMLKMWNSAHTRVFTNPLVADVDEFAAYVADVARLEAGKKGEREGEMEMEIEIGLESVFPRPRPLPLELTSVGEEQLLELLEQQNVQRRMTAVAAREGRMWRRMMMMMTMKTAAAAKDEIEGRVAAGAAERKE